MLRAIPVKIKGPVCATGAAATPSVIASGGLADSLDEGKPAFRAGGGRTQTKRRRLTDSRSPRHCGIRIRRPAGNAEHWEGLSAEIKLLAELEKDCSGRTKSEAQPTTTKLTDSDAEFRPVASNNKQPSLRKRAALGLARALIIFSMGVTATLAWQSWGTLRCLGCSVLGPAPAIG
jgi:hypothetical protein